MLIFFLDDTEHGGRIQDIYIVLDAQSSNMHQFSLTLYGDEVSESNATGGEQFDMPKDNYFPSFRVSNCNPLFGNSHCGYSKLSMHISKKDMDVESVLLISAFSADKNHENVLVKKGSSLRAHNNDKYPESWADLNVQALPYLVAGQANCLVLDAATPEVTIDLRAHY